MWQNPKYAKSPPARSEAPAESEKLAFFERSKQGRGDDEELRIELCSYQGHRYVGLRLWFRSPNDGKFYPTKKGVTIRRSELGDAIEALRSADRIMGYTPPRREPATQRPTAAKPKPGSYQRDFDEFSE